VVPFIEQILRLPVRTAIRPHPDRFTRAGTRNFNVHCGSRKAGRVGGKESIDT
jgi:hypothetical protein